MSNKALQSAAFFDVDGTLTSERTWKGIIGYFKAHKKRRATHAIFLGLHYPLYFLRRMGMLSESRFRSIWASHLAWYVRGFSIPEANKVWQWGVRNFLDNHWREDTIALLNKHLTNEDVVVLVSSAPQPFLEAIGNRLGVKHWVGTKLEIKNQRYTGRSLRPICIDKQKALMSRRYLDSRGIMVDLQNSCAYADSITDAALLEMVGKPTAVYPEAALRQLAEQQDWTIFPEGYHAS